MVLLPHMLKKQEILEPLETFKVWGTITEVLEIQESRSGKGYLFGVCISLSDGRKFFQYFLATYSTIHFLRVLMVSNALDRSVMIRVKERYWEGQKRVDVMMYPETIGTPPEEQVL